MLFTIESCCTANHGAIKMIAPCSFLSFLFSRVELFYSVIQQRQHTSLNPHLNKEA